MQLLTQCYESVEILQIRSELEARGIHVHIADEFTYAIPGMPGAEQPRGVWVADDDLYAAQLVIKDLLGEDRIHQLDDTRDTEPATTSSRRLSSGIGRSVYSWIWLAAGLILLLALLSLSAKASAFKEGSAWTISPAS